MSRPVIIDCDTGRDDALAIWLAFALNLPVKAVVTSYGNVALEKVSDNTSRVLSLAGKHDIPVLVGASLPSRYHKAFDNIVLQRQKTSGNGLCNVMLPKAKAVPRTFSGFDGLAACIVDIFLCSGPIDYVVLGPATNLSGICGVLGNRAKEIFSSVTMMGGKSFLFCKKFPGADFNILCDPWAVSSLLESGLPLRFVPMDFTWDVSLDLEKISLMRANTPIAQSAKEIMMSYCQNFSSEPIFRLHDPCVILALQESSLFESRRLIVECEETSPDFGKLIDSDNGFEAGIFCGGPDTRKKYLDTILEKIGLSPQ